MNKLRVAIFGASGSIGQALVLWFVDRGWDVVAVGRKPTRPDGLSAGSTWVCWDPGTEPLQSDAFLPVDAVVWAQGHNFNDSIESYDRAEHLVMYQANVGYVLESLHAMLKHKMLNPAAKLVVISSIWQNIARQNKLSYTVTKAAIQGLVQSLSIDLGAQGFLVNAVLPGALGTPMTRANLNAEQISILEHATPGGELPTLEDVCVITGFLCSPENTGINGQFIAADRGFSHARIL